MWYYKNSNGRELFGHNGSDTGSSTEMFISFSENIGVVLLTNSNNYDAMIQIENNLFDFAEETNFMLIGDINNDGIINILDIIQTVNLILVNQYSNSADINDDGIVNILDIVQIVTIILS